MLGKLFKLTSLQNVQEPPSVHVPPDLPKPINSFEDSYTRDILYGNLEFSLNAVGFNSGQFRLVVAQDGGNLRSKQVLYDSALDVVPGTAFSREREANSGRSTPVGGLMATPAAGSANPSHAEPFSAFPGSLRLPPKSLHNINDINDYMFGRGLPLNERTLATKVHLLPHFNSYRSVLISRLFLISDCVAPAESEVREWNPHAALPTKEASFEAFCKSPGSFDMQKSGFNSRFSIGVIIPLDDPSVSVEEVVAPCWTCISHHLIVLQKLVTRKLVLALKAATVNNVCPYINNRRILLPKGVLQAEHEISALLQKFMKLVSYNVNSPRILNINSVLVYALQSQNIRYKSKLVSWALEVINWLEYKDGRNMSNFQAGASFSSIHPQASHSLFQSMHNAAEKTHSSTFLASLLALIMPLREQLNEGPYTSESSKPKHVARIVIMTSNSVVAKKLIFILGGVIPNVQFCSEDVKNKNATETNQNKRHESGMNDTGVNYDLNSFRNIMTPSAMKSVTTSPKSISSSDDELNLAQPIPIKYTNLPKAHRSPSSASLSISSKLGWEVPTKSMASVSFSDLKTPTEENVTTARQIPSSQRLYTSSSIAYLSSSLNSSLSSSASNYSLSKLGSSFMDKWRGSLVGSTKPAMPGYNFDSMDGALAHDVLAEKPLFVSAKSPSPAYEYDEPIWEDSALPLRSASPGRKGKFSSGVDDKLLIKSSGGDLLPSVNIDRTKSLIYLPNSGNGGLKEKNARLIRLKLAGIMAKPTRWVQDGLMLKLTQKLGSVLERPQRSVVLNPNVAFVDAFRPEYIIQSCPANPRLENQVMSAMKNDLLFHHNNCGNSQVTSTTVFISLRAREIKLFEMSVGGESPLLPRTTTPPPNVHTNKVSGSPVTSYFSGIDHGYANKERRASNAYRTTIKKVFLPHKNSGDQKSISEMDARLEKLTEIVSLINNNGESSQGCRDDLDRMFYNSLSEILE